MKITKKKPYLSLSLEEKKSLILHLHGMRDSLKRDAKVKKIRKRAKKKMRKPTMLSEKTLKMFNQMSEEEQRFILYGE